MSTAANTEGASGRRRIQSDGRSVSWFRFHVVTTTHRTRRPAWLREFPQRGSPARSCHSAAWNRFTIVLEAVVHVVQPDTQRATEPV